MVHVLVQDVAEELVFHLAVVRDRLLLAGLCQRLVAFNAQFGRRGADLGNPVVELVVRHGDRLELHAREAAAAVVGGHAVI
ncbi:hypothetical protein D9M71_815560 [compost metagenome]